AGTIRDERRVGHGVRSRLREGDGLFRPLPGPHDGEGKARERSPGVPSENAGTHASSLVQLSDYEPLIGAAAVDRICTKARALADLRVVNFNATYYGGGVAETLSSLTLLMNTLRIEAEWRGLLRAARPRLAPPTTQT